MIPVQVECYAGYKGSERPLRFRLGSRLMEVETVEDQWQSPDITYFRIRTTDRKTYILKHNEGQDQWSLEVYERDGCMKDSKWQNR
jgi:hypothetical protein